MKLAIFSDLHIGFYGDRSGQRLENTLKCLDFILDICQENNIENVLFCGDLFDRESYLKVETVNAASKFFIDNLKKHINVYCINGNHDFVSINTANGKVTNSSLEFAINSLKNWRHVDHEPIQIHSHKNINFWIQGIDYHTYKRDFNKALDKAVRYVQKTKHAAASNQEHKFILMVHQTPTNIENTMIEPEIDINDKRLKNYDAIFCGHIHKPQRLQSENNNIFEVVGSPIHRDRGDVDDQKRFIILDLEKFKTASYPINMFPEFRSKNVRGIDFLYEKPTKKKHVELQVDNAKYDVSEMQPLEIMENYINEVKHNRDHNNLLKIAVEITNKLKVK